MLRPPRTAILFGLLSSVACVDGPLPSTTNPVRHPEAPVAVAAPPAEAAPPAPPMEDTLKLMFDGFSSHDAKKMLAACADGATILSGAKSSPAKDAVADEQSLFDSFPDMKASLTRTWVKGKVAIVEWVATGKNDGAFAGQKATGRVVGLPMLSIFFFDDKNLITEEHVYTDMQTLQSQLDPKAKPGTFRSAPATPAAVEQHVAQGTADEGKLVEWARAFDASFGAGKEDAILGTMAPDADFTLNYAPAASTAKTLKHDLHALFVAFPKQDWQITAAWGIEDFVIVEHTVTAKQMGPFGALPASKKDVAWHWVDILQVKDGKLAHGWSYANVAELADQVKPEAQPAAAAK